MDIVALHDGETGCIVISFKRQRLKVNFVR